MIGAIKKYLAGNKIQLTAPKKKELEKELKELESKGRSDIAEKLEWLRRQPTTEDENPFADILEDKNYLEKRISEIQEILSHSVVVKGKKKHTIVEVGSKVKVGFDGSEELYHIVSSVEADPLIKKISDESPVGKALMGKKVGDSADVSVGPVKKRFRILKIS
jgi:transcription elongation factor GreA